MVVALRQADYEFLTMEQYCEQKACLPDKFVVLRHDVDLRAPYSARIARIEHEEGAKASYYFRVIDESNQPDVVRAIAALGHEIGYHYEDLSITHGDRQKAIAHFEKWLHYWRQFYPVRTICMHGAPTSRYDGRALWEQYDYRDYGIIGEPYFDVDFSRVFYLTDTGRCWDGYKVSVRDKIPVWQDEWIRRGWVFHSTSRVIDAIANGTMPPQLMITTHPQRWTDDLMPWLKELLVQKIKNIVKRILILIKHG